MDDKNKIIADRILQEIDFVLNESRNMTETEFASDAYAQHALTMAILNIGELAKSLDSDYRAEHDSIPWQKVIGFRNVAAHGYDGLDMEIVWNTIEKDLPELKKGLT